MCDYTKTNVLEGVSTYYGGEPITRDEIAAVQSFMDGSSISAYNTRLFKRGDGKFELRLACGKYRQGEVTQHGGVEIAITYGDYGDKYVLTDRIMC